MVACVQVGYTRENQATDHKASPRLSEDICLRQIGSKSDGNITGTYLMYISEHDCLEDMSSGKWEDGTLWVV